MIEIFRTKFGSHLYGTSTPESDVDWKAVIIPDARSILLNRGKESFTENDKPDNQSGFQRKNGPGETDIEYHTLRKYLSLLSQGQTVALDMLFATPRLRTAQIEGFFDVVWLDIWNNRQRLFSKQAKSFLGYAYRQASKYGIKGSRMRAAEKVAAFFKEAVFEHGGSMKCSDLEDQWEREMQNVEHCSIVKLDQPGGKKVKCFECCGKKAMFTKTLKETSEIFSKLYDNYGERARKAKKNEGIDWKALSHAVRIGEQAIDFLHTGHIEFPRPNATDLLKIKTGGYPYMKVAERIESLLEEVRAAADRSTLRDTPDRAWIDDFVCSHYASQVKQEGW